MPNMYRKFDSDRFSQAVYKYLPSKFTKYTLGENVLDHQHFLNIAESFSIQTQND